MATTDKSPVDLMEIARRTAADDARRRKPGTVKAIAPAKINPVLLVGARRADGYHDVLNIMQTILLHDVLYLAPAPTSGTVTCECASYEDLPPVNVSAEDNLAVRAVRALAAEVFGAADAAPGVELRLEKHVPAQAGLGGGSADAAAALVGAAHLWTVSGALGASGVASAANVAQVAPPVLERVAATLGADVPFFLRGGAAAYAGTGTDFVRAFPSRKDAVVIIKPAEGLSTPAVYRAFDEMTAGAEGVAGASGAALAEDATTITLPTNPAAWQNALQAPAVQLAPVVGDIIAWAATQPGVTTAQMSGSGSAVFAICSDFGIACKLAAGAKLHGWWARATMCGAARAAVVTA